MPDTETKKIAQWTESAELTRKECAEPQCKECSAPWEECKECPTPSLDSPQRTKMEQRNMSKTTAVLYDATAVVTGARREAYGSAGVSFTKIARLWGGYLGREVLAKDVAMMMVLFKVAREQNAHSHDNLVDMAGYAALVAECVE